MHPDCQVPVRSVLLTPPAANGDETKQQESLEFEQHLPPRSLRGLLRLFPYAGAHVSGAEKLEACSVHSCGGTGVPCLSETFLGLLSHLLTRKAEFGSVVSFQEESLTRCRCTQPAPAR
jgi:hypothetical protein